MVCRLEQLGTIKAWRGLQFADVRRPRRTQGRNQRFRGRDTRHQLRRGLFGPWAANFPQVDIITGLRDDATGSAIAVRGDERRLRTGIGIDHRRPRSFLERGMMNHRTGRPG